MAEVLPGKGLEAGDKAQEMAKLIEKWLGNPVTRQMLKYATKRCNKCGRRIDNSLKVYAGANKKDLCFSCKTSAKLVSKFIDTAAEKTGIGKEVVKENLKDPIWRKGLGAVLEGIAEYGPVKPFVSFSPFLIVWNVTKNCNLRCKHCYEDAKLKATDELNTQEALELIDQLGDFGVTYIAISGGEPLTRPDLFQLAERMKKNEIAFSIATNATLLTKEAVKKLEKANCSYIQISLDGASAKTHDFLRGKGAFEKTMKGITNAVDSKIIVGISCTVTRHNLREFPKVVELSKKLGVDIFMHYNFIPVGRGVGIIDLDITPKEREELLQFLAKQKKEGMAFLSTAPQFARVCTEISNKVHLTHFDIFGQDEEMGKEVKFLADFVGGCGAGRLYMALEPNGDMLPCVFIPEKIGNIRKDKLAKIWKNHPFLLKLRDRKNFWGNCGTCKNKLFCGGCRARAFSYFKDPQAPDPGCVYNQKYWDELKNQSKQTVKVPVRK